MVKYQSDPLSEVFSALADPTRRAILARLAEGDTTVGDLAEPFAMSLPAVSKHLKVLQRAGLVEQGRRAQWRPCRIKAEPPPVPVCMMTAYESDAYRTRAEECACDGYLTKPIDFGALKERIRTLGEADGAEA